MSTKKLKKQPQVTIFAAVDGSTVKLFLANDGTDFSSLDTVKDSFPKSAGAVNVQVTILSTYGPVSVTDETGSPWPHGQGTCDNITLYWASTSHAVPTKKHTKFTDKFSISVGGIPTDPTAIIERTG